MASPPQTTETARMAKSPANFRRGEMGRGVSSGRGGVSVMWVFYGASSTQTHGQSPEGARRGGKMARRGGTAEGGRLGRGGGGVGGGEVGGGGSSGRGGVSVMWVFYGASSTQTHGQSPEGAPKLAA